MKEPFDLLPCPREASGLRDHHQQLSSLPRHGTTPWILQLYIRHKFFVCFFPPSDEKEMRCELIYWGSEIKSEWIISRLSSVWFWKWLSERISHKFLPIHVSLIVHGSIWPGNSEYVKELIYHTFGGQVVEAWVDYKLLRYILDLDTSALK